MAASGYPERLRLVSCWGATPSDGPAIADPRRCTMLEASQRCFHLAADVLDLAPRCLRCAYAHALRDRFRNAPNGLEADQP